MSSYCCIYLPLNQNDFPSTVMTHSGLSQEELRFVEGQGQSSEVITPSEELNRINDMGTAAHTFPPQLVNVDLSAHTWQMVLLNAKEGFSSIVMEIRPMLFFLLCGGMFLQITALIICRNQFDYIVQRFQFICRLQIAGAAHFQ